MKNMSLKKRSLALILCALLALSLVGCQNNNVSEQFEQFIHEEFVQAIESDYTAAHTYLQNPSDFGVDTGKLQVGLGARIDQDSQKEQAAQRLERYQQFQQFDRNKLNEDQQDTYDIYDYQTSLLVALDDEKFDYYQPLFESMSGIHYQLPIMLADWELRNEQDVQDLVIVMKDVRPYIADALTYTKTQQERGLLMSDLPSIIDYCNGILTKGENSSVLTSIYANIDALSLPKETSDSYKEQMKAAFNESFLPAYQDIKDTMTSFQSGQNNTEGLAKFPNGKAYYELLLQQNIGSKKTVEEVRTMMEQELQSHMQNMVNIMTKDSSVYTALAEGAWPKLEYNNYNEILEEIKQDMQQDFPAVSQLDYQIKNVNEDLASSSGIAAYFNIPPLDGSSVKQLRVNPKNSNLSELSTFSTVAHEGFPGHMYQYAYLYENLQSPFRKTLADSLAYTEGYAVYAQYQAMNYLDNVNSNLVAMYNENELATYCLIILADIGIHYDGWSLEQFKQFMESNGFMLDDEAMQGQYQQLQANPCTFEPYYVGYHEIAAMKAKAKETLGDRFSEKGFNEALLKSGAAPFNVVQRNIDKYCKSAS